MLKDSLPVIQSRVIPLITDRLGRGEKQIFLRGLPRGAWAFLAALLSGRSSPLIVVAQNEEEWIELENELRVWGGLVPNPFLDDFLPLPDFLPGDFLAALVRLIKPDSLPSPAGISPRIILTTISGLSDLPTPAALLKHLQVLTRDSPLKREEILENLSRRGYQRSDYVDRPGEYALRGEILDIFSPGSIWPWRLVFAWEKIQEIREFNPDTQISQRELNEITVIPAQIPESSASLLEYIGEKDALLFSTAQQGIKDMVIPEEYPLLLVDYSAAEAVDLGFRETPTFQSSFNFFLNELRGWRRQNWETPVFCANPGEEERLRQFFAAAQENNLSLEIVPGNLSRGFLHPSANTAVITYAEIFSRRPYRKQPLLSVPSGERLHHWEELSPGDYIVHERYGIGRFQGLIQLDSGQQTNDYLQLEYQRGDRLYIPITEFRQIQRYVGAEGRTPHIHSLDGVSWERIKEQVRKSVRDLAQEILRQDAERSLQSGISYTGEPLLEQTFAHSFIYEETPDQKSTIESVLQDLAQPRPMERLVLGDVGYGKTEVALRATLRVVASGYQVALLAPTTVLAEQHFQNFRERFADYPVVVALLSRFCAIREQKEIVRSLAKGNIDVVIGTHRLLGKDVQFNKLGLIIIDEEQRFGVRQKEHFKKRYPNLDILILSATPIPRTLHMALSGLRALSRIETAPEGRLPVKTYLGPYNQDLVREAVKRELDRQGQVFYVHNRVETLETRASYLKNLLPQARIGVVHGQLPVRLLEERMWEFARKKDNLLLTTTIIESGLDLPNVNTLIIEDATVYGLAQLYQLRGRVGRGSRLAYCYLFYPPDSAILGESALKRLEALEEFTSLGSSYRLALRDLEIRGAGNLLGSQQHGHIQKVGFELYCQLLTSEIERLKGKVTVISKEEKFPVFDLDFPAYLPADYIPTASERVYIYKRLLKSGSGELVSLRGELVDRFGKLPLPVEVLFSFARIIPWAEALGIQHFQRLNMYNLRLEFFPETVLSPELFLKFIQRNSWDVRFSNREEGRRVLFRNFFIASSGTGNIEPLNAVARLKDFLLGLGQFAKISLDSE